MTLQAKKLRGKKKTWSVKRAIIAHGHASHGKTDKEIATAMGIPESTFDRWQASHPIFQWALDKGRQRFKNTSETLYDYTVQHLSPPLRKVWKQIHFWCDHAEGPEKVQALLAHQGKHVRQTLWLHALMANGFNQSKACRIIGVSRQRIAEWSEDPNFVKLLDEIKWHRNNYFEHALVDLVQQRDPGSVMFANRTANRDRGYGDTLDVNVSGTVTHDHTFNLDSLNLPLEVRKQILVAIREQKEGKQTDKETKRLGPASLLLPAPSRKKDKATLAEEGIIDMEVVEEEDDTPTVTPDIRQQAVTATVTAAVIRSSQNPRLQRKMHND